MTALPKHLIIGLVAFVVIGAAGGGAWFWTAGQLEAAKAEYATVSQQIQAVQTKGFFPSSQNLKAIEGNQAEVTALAKDLLSQLDRATELYAAFLTPDKKGLPQETWKEKLVSVREELKKAGDTNGVETAEDFYFGFKRYRVQSPPAAATRDIGIQLAAIQQLSQLLIKSRVSEIREIRRVMVEDAGLPGNPGGAEEALTAGVVDGTGGLYRVYPLEVKFRSTPQALNKFINELNRHPMIFLIRFMVVENEKMTVPRRSEFAAPATGPEGAQPKLLVPIVGQEQVITRMRIDLIFWNGPEPEVKPATPAKGKPAKP
jgi:hypothetical protein